MLHVPLRSALQWPSARRGHTWNRGLIAPLDRAGSMKRIESVIFRRQYIAVLTVARKSLRNPSILLQQKYARKKARRTMAKSLRSRSIAHPG